MVYSSNSNTFQDWTHHDLHQPSFTMFSCFCFTLNATACAFFSDYISGRSLIHGMVVRWRWNAFLVSSTIQSPQNVSTANWRCFPCSTTIMYVSPSLSLEHSFHTENSTFFFSDRYFSRCGEVRQLFHIRWSVSHLWVDADWPPQDHRLSAASLVRPRQDFPLSDTSWSKVSSFCWNSASWYQAWKYVGQLQLPS